MQVLCQTELVPPGYGTSETLRPRVVLEQALQGLEQAGDTILPRIVYAPTLVGALKCASQEWDHPDAHQQVRCGVDRAMLMAQLSRTCPHTGLRPASVEHVQDPDGGSHVAACMQVQRWCMRSS